MNTTPYSRDYFPPAPVFPVKITPPCEAQGDTAHIALIDTGADGTFVPTALLEALNLPVIYMTNVRSHLGESLHRVPIHKVDVVLFDTVRLPNVEVVADDWGDHIIIGRNLLNKIRLHLDGPNEVAGIFT